MRFSIGDIVNVDGDEYRIVGRIKYKNSSDGMCWDEYRMMPLIGYGEAWLSVDDKFKEYSISKKAAITTSVAGYHLVDSGTEIVVGREGKVDVDVGDRADFYEYEDSTEEKIISHEVWDDEREVCTGYYLDEDEISFVRHDTQYKARNPVSSSFNPVSFIIVMGVVFVIMFEVLSSIRFTPSISKYLKKSEDYTYVTSITGINNQKAKVYKAASGSSIGSTAMNIINAIDGETQKVQQDTEANEGEDASVGILTEKEYCLVYRSEDGDVLIQVSDRKYAYSNDSQPYHSSRRVHSYYKRFYYSSGYRNDLHEYNGQSPYNSYDGDTMDFDSNDTYSSYASSVRQSSIYSRSSSGGGLSSGK